MNKLVTYEHKGEGYNPFLIVDNWQIAQLNFIEGQGFADFPKIEVHNKTDEAFLLTAGTAVLVAADVEGDNVTFEVESMKPGLLYNVPKGVWHNIGLSEDAVVFIVENSNTHKTDVTYRPLTDGQRNTLLQMVEKSLAK